MNSGEFRFDSYDERLEDFLESLDLNGKELGPVFRDSRVRIVMKPPVKKKDFLWIMTHYDTGEYTEVIYFLLFIEYILQRSARLLITVLG